MARRGWLVPGNCGELGWMQTDGETSIGYWVQSAQQLRLFYTWTPKGREPARMNYAVPLDWKACNYGGRRPYFNCPRCGDRRVVLYGLANDGRFGCRICMDLAYWSEALGCVDRTWQTQLRLEARLKRKRVGMLPARRIAARINECEARRFGALIPRLKRTLE